MNKSEIVMIGVGVLVVVFVGNMFFGSGSSENNSITGNAVAAGGEAQIVEIGLSRVGYTDITVEANKLVILKNDGTLGGCGLFVIQKELGINADFSKYDTYKFKPTKKGMFTYSCSMDMFRGTINVV